MAGDVDPEAVSLYRRARELIASGRVKPHEPRSFTEEYREIRRALRRIFHRRAWQCGVLDFDDATTKPPNPQWDSEGAAAIRHKLVEAAV